MSDNQEYIAKLEKAISQKYGTEAINNPKRFWDDEKEKSYIAQSQEEQRKYLLEIIIGLVLFVRDILFTPGMICI